MVLSLQQINGLSAGTYSVIVTDSNGCSKLFSAIINDVNSAIADAGADVQIALGDSILLTGSGGISYTWIPSAELSDASISNPTASPISTITYTLIVTDSNGCKDIDEITITVSDNCGSNEVFIPSAFSPNGDGQNDLFYVRNNCIQTMLLTIYNRWGEKVFESDDVTKGWDGKFKDKLIDAGVYAYYITATFVNNELYNNKGNINVVR